MHKTIAFLDLSAGQAFDLELVQDIAIDDIVKKIKADTGRELIIRFDESLADIGIVKYGQPIGYTLFAMGDIKEGQKLFKYGGKVVARNKQNRTAYKLEINKSLNTYDTDLELDAAKYGDLGSLVMHSFKSDELDNFAIKQQQLNSVQLSNLKRKVIHGEHASDLDVEFYADQDIQKGTLLCFSYGFGYWISFKVSPLLMSKSANPITDLQAQDPLICFKCYAGNGILYYPYSHIRAKIASAKELEFAFNFENRRVLYFNSESVKRVLAKIEKSGPNKELFHIIDAKDITQKLQKALANHKTHLNLRVSIFATKEQPHGPYIDAHVSDYENINTEIPEDIAHALMPS